jgi:hypothetical protein
LLPNDERENNRLNIFHHLCCLLLGGKLHLAPIGERPQRILDVGMGTEIWAIDMGEAFSYYCRKPQSGIRCDATQEKPHR